MGFNKFIKYAFVILVSAGVTYLLIQIWNLDFTKYSADAESKLTPGYDHFYYYHDFNKDGLSELVELKKENYAENYAVKVFDHNGGIIEQWIIKYKWIPASLTFGDYDGDNYDELYIFTIHNDSLFLTSFDPRYKNQFKILNKYLLSREEPLPPKIDHWDIRIVKGKLTHSDDDNFKDLVFAVSAGYSLQPRQVYSYSIAKDSIIFSSPKNGAAISELEFFDLNNDGKEELYIHTNAYNNFEDKNISFKDDKAWLMVFDHELNFLFPPKSFGSFASSINVTPFLHNSGYRIAAIHNYSGSFDFQKTLEIFDLSGHKLVSKNLDNNKAWKVISIEENNKARINLYDFNNTIYTLDDDLNIVSSKKLPAELNKYYFSTDLSGDMLDEHIFGWKNGTAVLSHDFSEAFFHESPSLHQNYSIRKNNKEGNQIVIKDGTEFIHISFTNNPLYPFKLLIHGVLFIIVFVLMNKGSDYFGRLFLYIFSTRKYFYESGSTLIIVDKQKNILKYNSNLFTLLEQKERRIDRENLNKIFKNFPSLLETINNIIDDRITSEKYSVDGDFDHKIKIKEMKLFKDFSWGYFIEIAKVDDSGYKQLNRWSKTVQKMVHDIKTPLSAIQINFQTLQYKLEDNNPKLLKEFNNEFRLIDSELNRVRQMTKKFLSFANLEKPVKKKTSLSEAVNNTIVHLNGKLTDTVSIVLDLDKAHDFIFADQRQIEMVLQILIENAVDVMPQNGIIQISSGLAQHLDKNFRQFIEIEVADNGIGIDDNIKKNLFEPFFTTKYNGTGMGLTIAKKIIQEHSGEISVSSRKDFATVVKIALPYDNI